MIGKPFLIVTKASYTDPTGVASHPDVEPGEEGWIEFKNPQESVLGIYYAEKELEAVEAAAAYYEVDPEVLTSYQLAKI
ncbi:hypothetical protein AAAC51_06840 [Priestia megaterium]